MRLAKPFFVKARFCQVKGLNLKYVNLLFSASMYVLVCVKDIDSCLAVYELGSAVRIRGGPLDI